MFRSFFRLFFASWLCIGCLKSHTLPEQKHCLVYVHIGKQFPTHLSYSLEQARIFNPECPIFLIGNSEAFSKTTFDALDVTAVHIESLKISNSHQNYMTKAKTSGFWRYALERFLLLDDFIQQYDLRDVFHIENDVMIYFNLLKKLPVFQEFYPNMIATVFDCDERSIPSFVYISNPRSSNLLSKFIAERAHVDTTDMETLSLFKDAFYKVGCDHLPILIPSYADDYPLTNIFRKTARDAKPYSNHLEKLGMVFDAAAIGQFLGGIDPILGESRPGFMGEASVFLPMFFEFRWVRDKEERLIPYISYNHQTYPIANLHIHSKALHLFLSRNKQPPEIPTKFFSSLPFDHIQPRKK